MFSLWAYSILFFTPDVTLMLYFLFPILITYHISYFFSWNMWSHFLNNSQNNFCVVYYTSIRGICPFVCPDRRTASFTAGNIVYPKFKNFSVRLLKRMLMHQSPSRVVSPQTFWQVLSTYLFLFIVGARRVSITMGSCKWTLEGNSDGTCLVLFWTHGELSWEFAPTFIFTTIAYTCNIAIWLTN